MVDDVITDLEIAVLCDLVDGPRVNLKAHRRSVLDGLVAKGLIAPAKDELMVFVAVVLIQIGYIAGGVLRVLVAGRMLAWRSARFSRNGPERHIH